MNANDFRDAIENAPAVVDLPDDLRIPLHSLQADIRYLFGRVAADGSVAGIMADSVIERLSQIETASLRLANPAVTDDLINTFICSWFHLSPDEAWIKQSRYVDAERTLRAILADLPQRPLSKAQSPQVEKKGKRK